MKHRTWELSERIQHLLILKSKLLSDVGLLDGKTGMAIAFGHLYKQTLNDVFDDCMSELVDNILETTYKGLDIGFASGFSGIGWGIEYMIQNGFVEGNGVEVCSELDLKIMEKDPRRIIDLSLETGLEGLLHYVLAHLCGAIRQGGLLPFDKTYLTDLYSSLEVVHQNNTSSALNLLINEYMDWHNGKKALDYHWNILSFIQPIEVDEKRMLEYPLGLREGLSGVLLKQLLR